MSQKVFNLQFLLTKKCNQSCYYCDNFESEEEVECDIDYIKWVISECYSGIDLHIELSGGEPGLVKNIEDVIKSINNIHDVKGITIQSNGLMRKKYGYMIDLVGKKLYKSIEHLVLDIEEKKIIYFYPDINIFNQYVGNFNSKEYAVIILTEKTVSSLIENFEYFKAIGLLENKIVFKILTPKTLIVDKNLKEKYKIFEELIKKETLFNYYNKNIASPNIYQYEDKGNADLCGRFSVFQFVDVSSKQICQCSMQVQNCEKYDFSSKDISEKTIKGELFFANDFCYNKCRKRNKFLEYFTTDRLENDKIWNIVLKEKEEFFRKIIKNEIKLDKSWIDEIPNININKSDSNIKLENAISDYSKIKRCVTVSNGTSAILLGMLALGLKENDKIIIPSYSYPAAYDISRFLNLDIILCDIKYDTLCLDPKKIKEIINSSNGEIRAVVYIEHLGRIDSDALEVRKICTDNGIYMIEDSAQSFAHQYQNNNSGSIGDFGIYSFSGNKLLKSGSGGCLVTNNTEIADKVIRLRDYESGNYEFSNILSSIVLSQLKDINSIIEKRIYYSRLYVSLGVPILEVPNDIYVGEHNAAVLHKNLEKFDQYCLEFGIKLRKRYYKSLLKTESVSSKVFNEYAELPYFGNFTEKEIRKVSSVYHLSRGTK